MPTITAVLFDLDGTLIDSIELIRQSFRHTMRVHFGTEPKENDWLQGLGTPLRQQFRVFTQDAAQIEALMVTYREFNSANHDAMIKEYAGANAAVRSLKHRGIKLGVVTSKLTLGAHRGLAVGGFDGLFDVVVGADDVTVHKPEAAPVLFALDKLGIAPANAVMVGDSPHDITAGHRAGTQTAAALWGPFSRAMLEPARPHRWLTSPSEMATLA